MDKFNIDSRFVLDGVFTLPSDPPSDVAGRISATSDGVGLELPAHVLSLQESLSTAIKRYDVVRGMTLDGDDCTVFDLFERPGKRIFLNDGSALTTTAYVANDCVMGLHLQGQKTKELDAAALSFPALVDWLRVGPSREIKAGVMTISYPLAAKLIVERVLTPISAKIGLYVWFNSQWKGTECSATAVPVVIVKPNEPESLTWFTGIATRLENFFSLLLGSSTHLATMRLSIGRKHGYVVRNRIGQSAPINRDACPPFTYEQIGDALERWFSLPLKFTPIENLIYGTIRNSSLFVETEFLSLAQAVESFHRVTNDRVLIEKKEFAEVRRVLGGLINFFFASEPALRQRLKESISHADEPSFRNRIGDLLQCISPHSVRALLSDSTAFTSTLIDTRNYLTHPGISQKNTVLTEPIQIYNMNRRLHALLRLLVLIHTGFSEACVVESVKKQLRAGILE